MLTLRNAESGRWKHPVGPEHHSPEGRVSSVFPENQAGCQSPNAGGQHVTPLPSTQPRLRKYPRPASVCSCLRWTSNGETEISRVPQYAGHSANLGMTRSRASAGRANHACSISEKYRVQGSPKALLHSSHPNLASLSYTLTAQESQVPAEAASSNGKQALPVGSNSYSSSFFAVCSLAGH